MTANLQLPAPLANLTAAGIRDSVSDITSSDIIVAAGDYTGGAAEDLFTLSSHGLVSGDVLWVLWESAKGGVTGGEATRAIVKYLSSSTFQLTSDGTTIIENTADATVVFLKSRTTSSALVEFCIIPSILAGTNDTTGGTVEDMMTVLGTGLHGAIDGDTIKLLYKSAAGVAGTLDATVYVKSPVQSSTVSYFQTSATAGGAVVDTTADGTFVFLKTS